jgi:hypothetical protein
MALLSLLAYALMRDTARHGTLSKV